MPIKRIVFLSVLPFLLSVQFAYAGEAVTPPVELADAPTLAVDWSKGDIQTVTLHGNRALTFSNGWKGGRYTLIITQDATGSRTVTWPSSVRWSGGPPQTKGLPANILTTTADKTDYITFFYNGVTYDVLGLAQNY
jgi:hypothetical protein